MEKQEKKDGTIVAVGRPLSCFAEYAGFQVEKRVRCNGGAPDAGAEDLAQRFTEKKKKK